MKKIYRYRSINLNVLRELADQKLWFSKYKKLNDPFECSYVNESNDSSIDSFLKTINVCCFSKIYNNLLMWAHYADAHKGICLEFAIEDENYRQSFFGVEYSDKKPVIGKIRRFDDGALKMDIDNEGKIFRVKSKEWQYEQEVRAIRIDDKIKEGILWEYPGKLTKVIFGANVTVDNIKLINKILRYDKKIVFEQAALSKYAYKLNFKVLDRNNLV